MKVYVLTVFLLILCVFSFSYLLGATLTLKPEVSVSGEKVYLKDILQDTSSISQNFLQEELFPAPPLGNSFTYSSGYIKQLLLAKLPALVKNNEIILPDKVKFIRTSQTLTPDEIFEFIKKDPTLEGLEIAPMSMPKVVLPEGDLRVEVKPLSSTNSKIIVVKLVFYVNNILVKTTPISLKVVRKVTVYVAKLHIPRGTLITEDLIAEKVVDNETPSRIKTKEEIIGKISTRELYPGQTITSSSIAEPPLVKKNEEVEAIQRVGPLTLSVILVALQDGYLGQAIRLKNPVSFREVRGTVTEKGKVEVFR